MTTFEAYNPFKENKLVVKSSNSFEDLSDKESKRIIYSEVYSFSNKTKRTLGIVFLVMSACLVFFSLLVAPGIMNATAKVKTISLSGKGALSGRFLRTVVGSTLIAGVLLRQGLAWTLCRKRCAFMR